MTDSKDNQEKFSYSLALEISQRSKDLYILKAISNYFGTGNIYSDKGISKVKFNNIKIIQHRLLPFFYNYPLLGFKLKQYTVWVRAVLLKISYLLPRTDLNNKILYKNDENIIKTETNKEKYNLNELMLILKELSDLRNKK
jgi:hypothetical protein